MPKFGLLIHTGAHLGVNETDRTNVLLAGAKPTEVSSAPQHQELLRQPPTIESLYTVSTQSASASWALPRFGTLDMPRLPERRQTGNSFMRRTMGMSSLCCGHAQRMTSTWAAEQPPAASRPAALPALPIQSGARRPLLFLSISLQSRHALWRAERIFDSSFFLFYSVYSSR